MEQLERGGLSHDTAAHILGVSTSELERLVQAGQVRRNAKNAYAVVALVQDYVKLRTSDKALLQADLAAHLDMSDRNLRELLTTLALDHKTATVDEVRIAYIRRLREQAAGRMGATENGLDLAAERAALAKAQREGVEIKNNVLRGDYASVTLLAEVLANASQSVAERFDHLPGLLRKTLPDLPQAAVDQVMAVIATARNEWARATVELVRTSLATPDDDEPQLDPGDEPRAD